MTREYVRDNLRILTYQLCKTTTYETEEYARNCAARLERLRTAEFNWLKIPQFEYTVDELSLTINTDYIKGWYCAEPLKLYDEIVLRKDNYTFTDPHPSNFITCSRTFETFAIDLDSYTKKWPFQDMHDRFIQKWSPKLRAHSSMIEQIQQLKSSRTDFAREVDHP